MSPRDNETENHASGQDSARGISFMEDVRRLSTEELDERKIIYPGMHNRDIINRFRELRTKMLQMGGRDNFVILVSSVCPGGGSTFTALNLAAAFALDQTKTALLVDCNLHTPQIASHLNIDVEFGLTDHLADPTVDVDQIIYATGVPRLRAIPVGNYSETGAEYFTSPRMKKFLFEVTRRYPDRYIVIDAPSISESADSRILSELCDCALLVVPYGKVVPDQVSASIEALNQTKLAGIVFNNT